MAAQQRVKPPTTSTAQVTRTQSCELVKTLLFVSASTVLSARSLFSERHFERRSIQLPKDAQFNYKDFVEQKPLGHRDKGIDCLARGKSTGADKFLDWLEKSVFHAMEREFLDCFQLRIFEDPECPDDVLETWTFKITYPDETGRAPEVADINIERKNGEAVTIAHAKDNLRDTVKSIWATTNMMRYLPINRYLGIYFFYSQKCDPEYMAPGHEDCVVDQINFPDDGICKLETAIMRPYQDGVHAFQIATTYVEKIDGSSDEQYMPANMVCNQNRSALADLEAIEGLAPSTRPANRRTGSTATAQSHPTSAQATTTAPQPARDVVMTTPSSSTPDVGGATKSPSDTGMEETELDAMDVDMVDDQSRHATLQAVERLNIHEMSVGNMNNGEQSLQFSQESQISIVPQDEHVAKELSNLKQALRITESSVGSTQVRQSHTLEPPVRQRFTHQETQAGLKDTPLETMPGANTLFESRIGLSDISLGQDSLLEPQELEEFSLIKPLSISTQYLDQLAGRRSRAQKRTDVADPSRKTRSRASQNTNSDSAVISCDCSTSLEEPDLLQCHFCGSHQHFRCYGYVGKDDRRIPEVHACYSCLLPDDKDKGLLNDLRTLALERRVVHIIELHGYTTDGALDKALGLNNLSTVKHVTKKLKEKQFLTTPTPPSSHKKKVWSIVSRGPKCESLLEELFDPTRKIIHLFDKQSLTSPKPVVSNYLGNTTDPLTRLSSNNTARERLGQSPVRINNSSNVRDAAMEDQDDIQVPRTPTNKRRRSSDDDTEGYPAKKGRRTSKEKDYIGVAGGFS